MIRVVTTWTRPNNTVPYYSVTLEFKDWRKEFFLDSNRMTVSSVDQSDTQKIITQTYPTFFDFYSYRNESNVIAEKQLKRAHNTLHEIIETFEVIEE